MNKAKNIQIYKFRIYKDKTLKKTNLQTKQTKQTIPDEEGDGNGNGNGVGDEVEGGKLSDRHNIPITYFHTTLSGVSQNCM